MPPVLLDLLDALLSYPPDAFVIGSSVLQVELCCFRVSRGGAVGVREERLNGREESADVVARRPLILEEVQAEVPVSVDVRVIHLAVESNFRRFVGISVAKGDP